VIPIYHVPLPAKSTPSSHFPSYVTFSF
jgi:hypothetical protein